jgi:cytochrome c5
MLRPARTALLAVLVLGAPPARAAAPLELHPTPEVELPFGDAPGFPAGPGSDVIASNCTACHSADHTLNQPSLSREEWHSVVDKMINAYKAPITPEDAKVIVDYLARVKGEP